MSDGRNYILLPELHREQSSQPREMGLLLFRFPDVVTAVQRGLVTCPEPHSWEVAERE